MYKDYTDRHSFLKIVSFDRSIDTANQKQAFYKK